MRSFLLTFLAVLAVLPAAASAAETPAPAGHLVLVGGGSKPPAAMEKFIELAGGRDAPIVVIPTASAEPDTPEVYWKLFAEDYRCSNVWVAPIATADDASDPEIARRAGAGGGIFFAGGDQRRIMDALRDTPTLTAIREAFARGAVVGGTSAGTACQSSPMITGDGDFTVITADNVVLWPGLGLFRGVIVDQHFVARQRENRLLSVVLEHPDLLGVGIDEATAVWVRPDGTFEVLGDGWVMVFDARGAEVRRQARAGGGTALGVRGLVTHVLLPGDVYDPSTRAATRSGSTSGS